jgi:hypothetical protein
MFLDCWLYLLIAWRRSDVRIPPAPLSKCANLQVKDDPEVWNVSDADRTRAEYFCPNVLDTLGEQSAMEYFDRGRL